MRVIYAPAAVSQLQKLQFALQQRITDKIDFYASQINPLAFAKKLAGKSAYRYRVGEYRVIFAVIKSTLYILLIVKRDKAYRDL